MIEKIHNVDFIKIECIRHIWSWEQYKNINQIQCWHDEQINKIKNDDNEIDTMIMKSSNRHEWIYATNKFTADNKMYDEW